MKPGILELCLYFSRYPFKKKTRTPNQQDEHLLKRGCALVGGTTAQRKRTTPTMADGCDFFQNPTTVKKNYRSCL
jgi:hypothetical protein